MLDRIPFECDPSCLRVLGRVMDISQWHLIRGAAMQTNEKPSTSIFSMAVEAVSYSAMGHHLRNVALVVCRIRLPGNAKLFAGLSIRSRDHRMEPLFVGHNPQDFFIRSQPPLVMHMLGKEDLLDPVTRSQSRLDILVVHVERRVLLQPRFNGYCSAPPLNVLEE